MATNALQDAPQVGYTESGFKYMGGDPNSQTSWKPLTGDEFLGTLPQQTQLQVKAIADGRLQLPSFALKTPYWQQMIRLTGQYDPNFDQVNFNARSSTRKDFTSGTSAQNLRNLNQAIGHMQGLADSISGVAGHSGFPYATTVNSAINSVESGMGDPRQASYNAYRTALSNELASVFKGKGGSNETEVSKFYDMLSPNSSTEQKQAAIRGISDMLKSRIDELGYQYNQGMGTTKDGLSLLNPHAAQSFQKLSGLGQEQAQTSSASPPAQKAGPKVIRFEDLQ